MRSVFRVGRYPSAVFVAVLLAVVSPVRADTYVGGVILSDTTWDLAGSPYIVAVAAGGSIAVGCDATLTIEPGVEVRFEPGQGLLVGWSAWGPGTLVARGTEQSPILFTSDQPTPAPGDWSRIDFLDQAADATFDVGWNYQSGCILEHVIVEYAGSGDYAAVNVDQSAPYLSYCEVRQNLWRGTGVDSAQPLRIENCYVHDNQDSGMYFSATPGNELTDNMISDNNASWGGGIHFSGSGGNTLTGNTISRNHASYYAGGIYFSGSDSNTLTANTISANSVGSGSGGGILFSGSGSNALTGNTISSNSAGNAGVDSEAGGICFYSSGSNTLTGNTISANSATYDAGGGIYFGASDSNTLTGNTISGNSAERGAGIYFSYSGSNTLPDNTINGNSASSSGGGIYFGGSDSNTLTGNTIEDNTAGSEGGALFLSNSDNNQFFDPNNPAGNTIRFNHTTAGQTGGIYVTSGSEWLSVNGGPEAYNTICCNDGYEVYNNNTFYDPDGRHDIDATNVFWGTDDTSVIQAEVYDFFDDASKAAVLWYPYIWPLPCDLDGDGDVDLADLAGLLGAYGTCEGDPLYNPDADFDNSGCIDLADLAELLGHYGEGC